MTERLHCVVQAGHVPRTTGATGANGVLGTEQQFTLKTATYCQKWLSLRGWTCEMIGADDDVPDSSVFVAIHHDGARNAAARGPSVGYPVGDDRSKKAAQEWKRAYGAAYPGPSFRPDNYTDGLKYYYGYRKTRASVKLVCEHGFGSNPEDARFMWSDAGQDAAVDAIEAVLGHWLGWDACRSPREVHEALNPGVPYPEPDSVPEPPVVAPVAAEEIVPEGATAASTAAEPPAPVTEEMPVSEVKSKAGHTAWQSTVATLLITSVEHLDGLDPADLPSQAAVTAAVATFATLLSAVKTWWLDRPGGGKHTS